jgi:UDP-N-acetylglucosamine 3-dehydrogenase
MKELKVGLVGFGVMGKNHARVIDELPGVVLDVVVELKPLENESRLTHTQFSNDLSFIKGRNLDYLVIATPTASHLEIALELFQHGIPILIEKPLAIDGKAALEIEKEAEKNATWGAVGHIERFNSAFQEAKKRIEFGLIGRILQISSVRKGPAPGRIMDVGVIKDLLTHDIDTVRWLTNDDYISVDAHKLNLIPNALEDSVIVIAKTKNGVLINHEVNWFSPIKERKTTLYGEFGVLVVDSLKAETTFYALGRNIVTRKDLLHLNGSISGEVTQFSFDKHEPLKVEHEIFRDTVLGKEDGNVVSLSFARRNVEIADEVFLSSERNI